MCGLGIDAKAGAATPESAFVLQSVGSNYLDGRVVGSSAKRPRAVVEAQSGGFTGCLMFQGVDLCLLEGRVVGSSGMRPRGRCAFCGLYTRASAPNRIVGC